MQQRAGLHLALLRRAREEPGMSLWIVRPVVSPVWRILWRMDDLSAGGLRDLVVSVTFSQDRAMGVFIYLVSWTEPSKFSSSTRAQKRSDGVHLHRTLT